MTFSKEDLRTPHGRETYEAFKAFLDIFSPETQTRFFENSIVVKLSFEKDYNNTASGGKTLSHVVPSLHANGMVGKMELVSPLQIKANVRIHEWWHALVFQRKIPEIKDGYFLSHGLHRYKKGELGTSKGSGFDEGMAEVTSILAFFKRLAKERNDMSILRAADDFMNTGKIDSNRFPEFFQGYFKCYSDIARLFIKASRNDFMLTHDFVEVLSSSEGIDGKIEPPVNKPYSTYIHSAVCSDLKFQEEYDAYEKAFPQMLTYDKIGEMMDGWFGTVMKGGRLNNEQKNEMQLIINSISLYNYAKLHRCSLNGFINKEKRDMLIADFEKTADILRESYKVTQYGNPPNPGNQTPHPTSVRR